jgi:CHASE3 domain sensor protein
MKLPMTLKGLLIALLLLVLPGVAAMLWTFDQMEEAAQGRHDSGDVLTYANQFLSSLNDAESGQRGYLLTGDASYLRQYTNTVGLLPLDMAALRKASLEATALARLDATVPLLEATLAELMQSITTRQAHDLQSAMRIVETGRGKALMDALRVEMAGFMQIEETAFRQYDERYQVYARYVYLGIVVSSALALLYVLYFVYTVLRNERQRPLRITPMQKLLGDASTGDIATMAWVGDYDATLAGSEPCNSTAATPVCWHLSLRARRAGVSYQRIEVWLGKLHGEPVRADLYVLSDKLAKQARFVMDHPEAPSMVTEMVLSDQVSNHKTTHVRYLSRKERRVAPEWLNPMFLVRNPALD